MGTVWEVDDESGCRVLDGLESAEKVIRDPGVESIAVVQSVDDEGLCDGTSGVLS